MSDNDTQMLDEIRFDNIEPIEISVRLGSDDYLLIEAHGGAVCAYKDALMSRSEIDPIDKKVKVRMNPAADATLLARCLFKMPDRKPVTVDFVQGLPNRVIETLAERVKLISELNKEDKDKEDKDKTEGGPAGNLQQTQPPAEESQPGLIEEQKSTLDG